MSTNTKWYVIRIVAGKEKKAIEQLEYEIRSRGFSDMVKQIVIPTEKTYHLRKGKKICVEKNHYPGYVLIETDPGAIGELKGLHKTANFIVGFLGGENPTPLTQDEVNRILNKMDEMSSSEIQHEDVYTIGEIVNIGDGPFKNFSGTITEILKDKKRLKIDVKIFGRNTPVELNYEQIERVY